MYYNYEEAIKEDIRVYLGENYAEETIKERITNFEDFYNELSDKLWIEDSVTGNASGSYTCNSATAGEYLARNFSLLAEALREFGCDVNALEKGEEWCDVTIRCYLLNNCLYEVLTDIQNDIESEDINNE